MAYVNQIEIYNDFLSCSGILNNENIKTFTLNNSVNDLILNYETIVNYLNEEDLYINAYYECVSSYIMKNNFNSIKNIKNIFMIFPYLTPSKIDELITYLYPLIKDDLQNYFNYELIIILYTIIMHKDISNESNLYEQYYELFNNLYEKKIIKNPIYSTKEEKECETYNRASIFDIFVHASYISESYKISLIFLKLIINEMGKMSNEILNDFHTNSVNIDILYTLHDNINNINLKYINIIKNDEKEDNIYINNITFFVAKMFAYMKMDEVINNYTLYNENVTYYTNIYFNNMLKCNSKFLDLNKNFNPNEFVYIIGDLFRMNNNDFYELFLNLYNESTNISKPTKVFILNIWFRYIYYILNKNNNLAISYDSKSDKYYINTKIYGKKMILRTDYMNDIKSYMEHIYEYQNFIYNFLVSKMNEFLNIDYPEMIQLCNSCTDRSCVICLENVENVNMNICFVCKKIFHESCVNQVWKSGHDNCPLCRKYINSTFYTFPQLRYNFIKDILEKINN